VEIYNMFSYVFWKSLLDSQGFKMTSADRPPIAGAELKQADLCHSWHLDQIVSVESGDDDQGASENQSTVESLIFPNAGHTQSEWGFLTKSSLERDWRVS